MELLRVELLSVVSRLLDYPDQSVLNDGATFQRIIAEAALEPALKAKLQDFVAQQLATDLLDWQSDYDGLFERGRSLGLWLFEHVHGESRDRGQAMVDLLAMYRSAGLEISQHELPDYIPLFLEFLSTQGPENAKSWLQDVEHILALLLCRLEKRGSAYSVLFETLLAVAQSSVKLDDIRAQIASEKRDDTKHAIDKEWAEEEVTFGAESLEKSCETSKRRPSESQRRDLDIPVNWVDFDTTPSLVSARPDLDLNNPSLNKMDPSACVKRM